MKFFKKRGSKKELNQMSQQTDSPGFSRNVTSGHSEKFEEPEELNMMEEQTSNPDMARMPIHEEVDNTRLRPSLSDRIMNKVSSGRRRRDEGQPIEEIDPRMAQYQEQYEEEEPFEGYEEEQPEQRRKGSTLSKLAKLGAESTFVDFIMKTAKRELFYEFSNNFDVWAERILDIVEQNIDLLKGKSVDFADIVRERVYLYEDKVKQKLEILLDKVQEQLEVLDEKMAPKFNLQPGTITKVGIEWLEQLEVFLWNQLDLLMQIIDEQIDIVVQKAHDRIDLACERGYQQAVMFKNQLTKPAVRPAKQRVRKQRPRQVPRY